MIQLPQKSKKHLWQMPIHDTKHQWPKILELGYQKQTHISTRVPVLHGFGVNRQARAPPASTDWREFQLIVDN